MIRLTPAMVGEQVLRWRHNACKGRCRKLSNGVLATGRQSGTDGRIQLDRDHSADRALLPLAERGDFLYDGNKRCRAGFQIWDYSEAINGDGVPNEVGGVEAQVIRVLVQRDNCFWGKYYTEKVKPIEEMYLTKVWDGMNH
jgi:hypothetical protein